MGAALTVQNLAAAIEREENTADTSLNNPGAITGANGQLNAYPTIQAGQQALTNQLNYDVTGESKYYSPDESLEQFEETYTGGDLNAGSNVASFLGIPASTPIGSFSPQIGGSGFASQPSSTTSPATSTSTPSATASSTPSISQYIQAWLGGPKSAAWKVAYPNSNTNSNILVDGIVIVVGIVLIAGAVFGFKTLQTTVVQGVKDGAA